MSHYQLFPKNGWMNLPAKAPTLVITGYEHHAEILHILFTKIALDMSTPYIDYQ